MSYARIAFATLFAGLSLCTPATAVADVPPASAAMIAKVNEMRHSSGLSTLQTTETLVGSARGYARYMLRNDYLGHLSSIQAGGKFLFLGETLAWHTGWKPRVAYTFSQWMNSPPHRAALMSPTYRFIGAGRVRGRLGRTRETAWVAQLGGLEQQRYIPRPCPGQPRSSPSRTSGSSSAPRAWSTRCG